ncbi:MAG: DNA repair protein RecO [Thiolinea sp.]
MSSPSLTYILRRNAYRDNSLLLDCFNEYEGRITVVARFSKRQSNRIKGMLEPFRLLDMRWSGKGDVHTLVHAEEKRRYALKQGALVQATYANELLLRAFQPGEGDADLFAHYRRILHHLEGGADLPALMQFELAVLAVCGYELNLWQDDATQAALQPELNYHFQPERGLLPLHARFDAEQESLSCDAPQNGVLISGELLIALRYPEVVPAEQWQVLRRVLDQMLALLLNGKTLYARQLLSVTT